MGLDLVITEGFEEGKKKSIHSFMHSSWIYAVTLENCISLNQLAFHMHVECRDMIYLLIYPPGSVVQMYWTHTKMTFHILGIMSSFLCYE